MKRLELKEKYIIVESTDDSLTGYIINAGIIEIGNEIEFEKGNNKKTFEVDIIEFDNNEYTLLNSNNSIVIKPY